MFFSLMLGIHGSACGIALIFCSLTVQVEAGDTFTSLHDMEAWAQQEQRMMQRLHYYITSQSAKLKVLYSKWEQIAKIWTPGTEAEQIIRDPINGYALMRRLAREWPVTLNLMTTSTNFQDELPWLPNDSHLETAMRGLMRLQDVYGLETGHLANNGLFSASLTAMDCFEIGKFMMKEKKYESASSWFLEAIKKVEQNDTTVELNKVLSHFFIATNHLECQTGRGKGASNVLNQLILKYPDYALDEEAASLFRQALAGDCPLPPNDTRALSEQFYGDMFSRGCQGLHTTLSPELKCFHIDYNKPRLLIAPFKMEELSIDPPILVFHEVISDQEIAEMKAAFVKVKSSCKVRFTDTKVGAKAIYRNCDVGWVGDDATAASARITRRAGDITNLDMASSEPNQVASYGLGGEFMLHYDNLHWENITVNPHGSRLATLMFYMNDVESGGFTTFPDAGVRVKPQKGSAVFWYNINQHSHSLDKTLHGGCPVLRGSKWVLNKWIHEANQTSNIFCPANTNFPIPRYYLNKL